MLNKLLQVIAVGLFVLLAFGDGNPVYGQSDPESRVIRDFETIDGIRYLRASRMQQLLQVKTYHNPQVQKIIFYLPDDRIKLSANCSFVMVNSQIYHLPHLILPRDDDLLVPVESFVRVMEPHLQSALKYDERLQALRVNYSPVNITDIVIDEKKNGTIIRLPTRQRFGDNEYKAWLGDAGWFYLTVAGGYIQEERLEKIEPSGIVRKIVPIQHEGSVQFSFQLREMVETYEYYQNENPGEIVLTLRKAGFDATAELREAQDDWRIDRIVLDAGHGGKDPGTVGVGGVYEKDVVLDVTKRLGRLIEKRMPDVEVIYTRNEDRFLSLKERTQLANAKNGKLFVSIHANANHRSSARGFETYLLRPGKTEDAISVAERENSVIKYEESTAYYEKYDNEKLILATMMQSAFMKESEELASMVQDGLDRNIRSRNRGVKQAGFYVLWGTSMPNILVEIGFLTNPTEGRKLQSGSYQQQVAEGIFKGLEEFKSKYEKPVVDQASL